MFTFTGINKLEVIVSNRQNKGENVIKIAIVVKLLLQKFNVCMIE